MEPHTPAYSRIVYHFGPEILLENGEIDRQKLGQLIFSDEEKRKLLNSITHPEIHKAMLKEILFYFLKGELGIGISWTDNEPIMKENSELAYYFVSKGRRWRCGSVNLLLLTNSGSYCGPGYRYVVLDVPLLFETRRLTRFLNHTVVVYWWDHFSFFAISSTTFEFDF